MPITNAASGTNVHEIADGLYRINTPVTLPGAVGFSFNQYLVVDEEPLLFHTGPRKLFPLVRDAVASVMPVARLRHVAFSHVEADECGSLNEWLAAAPQAAPLCGSVAAMVSIGDLADRPPRALADGETARLGRGGVTWLDAPHFPHGWECGFLFETRTRTLLCGDLFTQPGGGEQPVTEQDVLAPSEAFRKQMDYFAHGPDTARLISKLAATRPVLMACMHGSAWRGDGARLLAALGDALES
jgi:flavorubredoxin